MGLNPCCSGRWSRTISNKSEWSMGSDVLILVVVDDGLVLLGAKLTFERTFGLNPCCSGRWSRTTPFKMK